MTKIITIMQPAYLAWPGFYQRMMLSDVCVILDHVLIDKSSKTKFANRNRVRTPQGWTWLSVPIQTKGKSRELFINEITVDQSQKWAAKHHKTIDANYRKAPFYGNYADDIAQLYTGAVQKNLLVDVIASFDHWVCDQMGLKSNKILRSSEMQLEQQGSDLIVEICQALEATHYISGPFGRDYLMLDHFQQVGIKVLFHDYSMPEYQQCWPGFEANLAMLDVIMNLGGSAAKVYLQTSIDTLAQQ